MWLLGKSTAGIEAILWARSRLEAEQGLDAARKTHADVEIVDVPPKSNKKA
jgi:hypothetical protein